MQKNRLSLLFQRNLGFLLVILFMTTSAVAFAQQGGQGGDRGNSTPEERAKRLTGMMKDQLKLTAAQEPKVSAINLKYAKKNEDLKAVADTSLRRKTALANDKAKDGELKAVFTASQFKEYLVLKEEMKARRGKGGGQRP
jgi:Spy/CpxP family protein refolding chaperone